MAQKDEVMSEVNIERCPLCYGEVIDRQALYDGPWEKTILLKRCSKCGTWFVGEKFFEYQKHFETVGYCDPQYENTYYQTRIGLFKAIVDRFISPLSLKFWTELGPAYGHLLAILREKGYGVYGVEVSTVVKKLLRERGFFVRSDIKHIPDHDCMGLVCIDSIYYLPCPNDFFDLVSEKCQAVVMRTVNRTPLLNVFTKFFPDKKVPKIFFGDALFCPTVKGLKQAMSSRGFSVSVYLEPLLVKIRGNSYKKKIYYVISYLLSKATRIPFTPGVIIVALKTGNRQ